MISKEKRPQITDTVFSFTNHRFAFVSTRSQAFRVDEDGRFSFREMFLEKGGFVQEVRQAVKAESND